MIAFARQEIMDETYLISLKKEGEEVYLKTRLVRADAPYLEVATKLSNAASGVFSIKAHDNRGLADVVNMLHVDLLSEACGVEGG